MRWTDCLHEEPRASATSSYADIHHIRTGLKLVGGGEITEWCHYRASIMCRSTSHYRYGRCTVAAHAQRTVCGSRQRAAVAGAMAQVRLSGPVAAARGIE